MYQPVQTQPQSSDHLSSFKEWWNTCPLLTKSLIYFCSILFIITRVRTLETMLYNIPSRTFGDFQVTRLIFSPFCFGTIAELGIAFVAYLPLVTCQERNSGSLAAIIDFFFKNLEVNIFYIIACYLLGIVFKSFLEFPSYGLWNIFFVHITEIGLKDPESTTPFLFTSFPIRNSLYPLILAVLFFVISPIVRFDIVVAMVVGFLNVAFINPFYYTILNPEKITEWENSSVVVWLKSFPNFVVFGTVSQQPLINENDFASGGSHRNSGIFDNLNYQRRGSEREERKNSKNVDLNDYEGGGGSYK